MDAFEIGSMLSGMIERATNQRRGMLSLALFALSACERGELLGTLGTEPGPGREPFAPRPVPGLSLPDSRDTDPTFTGNALELYFMSDRTGSKDLYRARRSRASLPWGAPERVDELSTGYQEENPAIANDGLTLWFFSDRDRSQASLWQSTRASTTDPWQEPTPVPELALGSGSSSVEVGVDESGTLAVLCARPAGSGSYDLYVSERAAPERAFSEPVRLERVNGAGDEFDGVFVQGGLFLAFHAQRGQTDDLYFAQRTRTADPFDAPRPIAIANTDEFEEGAPALSTDLRYLMFSTNRDGSHDLYEAILEDGVFDQ